jgi:hypothetical protein
VPTRQAEARASVPSMGRVSLDERSQPEPMTATVAEPQGLAKRRKLKEAAGKLSTVGTQTGSEAGCGRQTGWQQRSPKVIQTHPVEPVGARGQILHLTWGDLPRESAEEVTRSRSSEEAAVTAVEQRAEGPRNGARGATQEPSGEPDISKAQQLRLPPWERGRKKRWSRSELKAWGPSEGLGETLDRKRCTRS